MSEESLAAIDKITWTMPLEQYLAGLSEKAHCLSWIHKHAENMFSYKKVPIDLAVIIGSAILGFLNAGSSTLFQGKSEISSVALGIGSLIVSTLNTITTYFGYAKRCEGHRLSSIYYAKLHRFIAIELTLPREQRIQAGDLLKMTKDQYERLAETSPALPKESIQQFKTLFSDAKYDEISKPEQTNSLEKVDIYSEEPTLSDDLHIRIPQPSLARRGSGFQTPVLTSLTQAEHPYQAAPVTKDRIYLKPIVADSSLSGLAIQSHSEAKKEHLDI